MEVVAARPRPDKWSIQEIVEHLVLSKPHTRRTGAHQRVGVLTWFECVYCSLLP